MKSGALEAVESKLDLRRDGAQEDVSATGPGNCSARADGCPVERAPGGISIIVFPKPREVLSGRK